MTELPRLLPRAGEWPVDFRAHRRRHGPVPYQGAVGVLVDDLRESGLTGRGGAAFPVHRKLSAVLEAARRRRLRPVVIANGAEGEPASGKDAALLAMAPHLVLDGLQLAAEAVGADQAIVYTHTGGAGDAGGTLEQALAQRRGDRVPCRLATAPARFLSGQETALVNRLDGGPAIPLFASPRITERGLRGVPTLVQNVETLAHLALIARYGPRWFRAIGTNAAPGSTLCTIRREDGRPRIAEVPLGIPLRNLLGLPAERAPARESAVLIGGYHGTWVPAAQAARLRLDNDSLRAVGATVGAGIVIALPSDRCGLAETARVARYLALESAGQCGPCLNGLPRMSAALLELAAGRAPAGTRADLERWAGLMPGRGACRHPDGTVRFVRSALAAFAPELARHERGQCGAASRQPFLPVPRGTARTEEDWR
jgi:NADH:ubiquinone oxidoreductase subunit F (NADH-binding)